MLFENNAREESDSRMAVAGRWTCEDCGSLVANDVEICATCEVAEMEAEEHEAEYNRDLMLESQEMEDYCECDESYGCFGYDEY